MNLYAVNDLIECSLLRWYRIVSEWRAPADGTESGCVSCRASEFAAVDSFGDWPHDLIHSLVDTLELAAVQLAVALHDERHSRHGEGRSPTPCTACLDCARTTVRTSASRHGKDITDVINECAMPRLAAYVEMNTNLALNAATRGEWAS